MNYKWVKTDQVVLRKTDNAHIPNSSGNLDWQRFQAEGGVADPEDPPPIPDPRLVTDETERQACKVDAAVLPLVNQTKAEWITWAGANFPSLTAAEKTRLGILFWVVSVGVRRSIRNGGG